MKLTKTGSLHKKSPFDNLEDNSKEIFLPIKYYLSDFIVKEISEEDQDAHVINKNEFNSDLNLSKEVEEMFGIDYTEFNDVSILFAQINGSIEELESFKQNIFILNHKDNISEIKDVIEEFNQKSLRIVPQIKDFITKLNNLKDINKFYELPPKAERKRVYDVIKKCGAMNYELKSFEIENVDTKTPVKNILKEIDVKNLKKSNNSTPNVILISLSLTKQFSKLFMMRKINLSTIESIKRIENYLNKGLKVNLSDFNENYEKILGEKILIGEIEKVSEEDDSIRTNRVKNRDNKSDKVILNFAGNKDKRAITSQQISSSPISLVSLYLFNIDNFLRFYEKNKEIVSSNLDLNLKDEQNGGKTFNDYFKSQPIVISEIKPLIGNGLKLGNLCGNKFKFIVRLNPENEKESNLKNLEKLKNIFDSSSFISNYFGTQRFGRGKNHIIGHYIANKNFENAYNIFQESELLDNSNKKEDYKVSEKEDFKFYRSFFYKLPKTSYSLFVHSYQSYIFNVQLSFFMTIKSLNLDEINQKIENFASIENEDKIFSIPKIEKFYCKNTETVINLSENKNEKFDNLFDFLKLMECKNCKDSQINCISMELHVLNPEVTKNKNKKICRKKILRSCFFKPKNLKSNILRDEGLELNFTLGSSQYATVFITDIAGDSIIWK